MRIFLLSGISNLAEVIENIGRVEQPFTICSQKFNYRVRAKIQQWWHCLLSYQSCSLTRLCFCCLLCLVPTYALSFVLFPSFPMDSQYPVKYSISLMYTSLCPKCLFNEVCLHCPDSGPLRTPSPFVLPSILILYNVYITY